MTSITRRILKYVQSVSESLQIHVAFRGVFRNGRESREVIARFPAMFSQKCDSRQDTFGGQRLTPILTSREITLVLHNAVLNLEPTDHQT